MRWVAAGIAIVLLIVVGIAAWLYLPPPTSGAGWRLGPATWHQELGTAPGGTSRVIAYAADENDIGVGVTVFGSSSCPPKLRDVRIGSAAIEVEFRGDPGFGACTADLAPHPFGILVERDALPPLPFSVVVIHAGEEAEHEVTELP